MKKLKVLMALLGLTFILQGCVYPPYGPSVAYNRYDSGYQPYRNRGWGGHYHHSGGGYGWRGHHGWRHGDD